MPDFEPAQPHILGKGIFGAGPPDPSTMLLGLVADMAVIRSSGAETVRRLSAIEHSAKTGADAMTKAAERLTKSEMRLDDLEEDIIPNGKLRIETLEKSRSRFIGLVISVATAISGWFALNFLAPLLKH